MGSDYQSTYFYKTKLKKEVNGISKNKNKKGKIRRLKIKEMCLSSINLSLVQNQHGNDISIFSCFL
jgi:hypothetical protein